MIVSEIGGAQDPVATALGSVFADPQCEDFGLHAPKIKTIITAAFSPGGSRHLRHEKPGMRALLFAAAAHT